jgi:hypothetical protein
MPIIRCNVSENALALREDLQSAISKSTVATLNSVFPRQLGFVSTAVQGTAEEVVNRFSAGWVWVSVQAETPMIGASPLGSGEAAATIEIRLLENALEEMYQDEIVSAVAAAARSVLTSRFPTPNLAIINLTGNVQMTTPGAPDSLLKAAGVHDFLTSEIRKELVSRSIVDAPIRTVPSAASPTRRSYYEGLKADYSRPGLVSPQLSETLLNEAKQFIDLMDKSGGLPAYTPTDQATKQRLEEENKAWWPTHCEALRRGRADLLAGEYRDQPDLVYFCQDGPFYGKTAGTDIESSWWKVLSQPGVTMCWPIVMFHGEVVYFEWKCTDDATGETTAKGNVTFMRRGHKGGVYLKTEQLTFYRDVHARFFAPLAQQTATA